MDKKRSKHLAVRVCFDRRILGDLERAELELQVTPAPAEAEQLRRTVG